MLAVAVGGWVQNYQGMNGGAMPTLRNWTCANKVVDHHDVDFKKICKEIVSIRSSGSQEDLKSLTRFSLLLRN